jgi:hypothetical protein
MSNCLLGELDKRFDGAGFSEPSIGRLTENRLDPDGIGRASGRQAAATDVAGDFCRALTPPRLRRERVEVDANQEIKLETGAAKS